MDILDINFPDQAARLALRDVIERVARIPGVAREGQADVHAYMDAAGIVANVLVDLCRQRVQKLTVETLT